MNQFFFGDSNRPLYGVHHAPSSVNFQNTAVLFCYPIGREYMRCHRALVRLCDRLSRSGFHSLRFDYFGTGDSSGSSGSGDIDEWVANTRTAASELRDISGAEHISIVGVRLGGAIATQASSLENNIDKLVLWDPIADGESYMRRLTTLHKAFTEDVDRFPKQASRNRNFFSDELIGMTIPPALRDSIRRIDINALQTLNVSHLSVVATHDHDEYRATSEALGALTTSHDYHVVDEPAGWDTLSDMGVVMMPHQMLQTMLDKLSTNIQ